MPKMKTHHLSNTPDTTDTVCSAKSLGILQMAELETDFGLYSDDPGLSC